MAEDILGSGGDDIEGGVGTAAALDIKPAGEAGGVLASDDAAVVLSTSKFFTINMGDYGAEPEKDCTALVLKALEDARSAEGIKLHFPAGKNWEFSLALGEYASNAGKSIIIEGEGKYATTFGFKANSWSSINYGDAAGNQFIIRDCRLNLREDRAYDNPCISLTLIRHPKCDNVRVTGAEHTGTMFKFDGCYEFLHEEMHVIEGKYLVPFEVVNVHALAGGENPPYMDTFGWSNVVVQGCCGAIIRDAKSTKAETSTIRFPNFKVSQTGTAMYPETTDETIAQVMTTLVGTSKVGDKTIEVASVGAGGGTKTLRAGDAIGIGMAGDFELNKVTKVEGKVLTLAQPLVYAHPAHGTETPVIQGGIGIVLGDGISTPDMSFVHMEGMIFGIDCGNVRAAKFGGKDNAKFFVRASGSLIGAEFGPTIMKGSPLMGNNLVCKPTYAYGTEDSENYLNGPFPKSYLSFIETPVILPVTEAGVNLTSYAAWISPLPVVPPVAGLWYPNYATTESTLVLVKETAYVYPLIVTATHTWVGMGVNVTAGGASSVLRFGIYVDNGAAYPGALVKDLGTASSAGTGTISPAEFTKLLPPGLYWLTVAAQESATPPTLTSESAGSYPVFGANEPGKKGTSVKRGYSIAGGKFGGAFPAAFPAAAGQASNIPIIHLKA